MGIAAGPNVPRDGLALWYDFSTTRSFRGQSTTNLVTDPDLTSGSTWGVSNYMTSAVTVTFESEGGVPHMKLSDIVSWGSSYPRIGVSTLTSTISSNYSASYEAKGTPGSSLQISFYSSGSTKVSLTATLTNNWQRFEFPNTSNAGFTLDSVYIRPLTTGATQYIRRVQAEATTYVTPYVNGTRGSTVAAGGGVVDLSGRANGGELVNGVTASSLFGGIVSFDGTNDYLDTTLDLSWNNTNSATIMMFVKPSSLTSYYPFIGKGPYDWEWQLMQKNTSLQFVYWNTGGGHTNGPIPEITNFFNSVDEFVHVAMVWSHVDNKYYFYRNGVLVNTTTWVDASINQNRANNIRIGGHIYIWQTSGYFWPGSVGEVKAYNTALTAAQVDQSYRASEARFAVKPNPIVSSGLVLHLDAANRDSYRGSGTTWTDLSGYGYNGTLTNGPVYTTGSGGSISLDGTNDLVLAPSANTMGSLENQAYDIWVKTPGLGTGKTIAGLVCPDYGMVSYITGNGNVQYIIYNTDNNPYVYLVNMTTSGLNLYDNSWHHIVCTRNSSNASIYVDGTLIASTGGGGTWTGLTVWSSMNTQIGNNPNDAFYNLKGNIASVRIYRKYLTAAEVLQNYNATRARFGL